MGIWREPLQAFGLRATVQRLRDAGLRVSSLCRGGFFTASEPSARREALTDNRRYLTLSARDDGLCHVGELYLQL